MIVVRDDRRVVSVTGDDRRSFLDAVLSQHVADLPPGSRTSALWLDVHGAPLAVMDVLAPSDDKEILLVVSEDQAEAVATGLGGRTFLAQATFRVTDLVVVAVRGDGEPATSSPLDGVATGVVASPADDVVVAGRPDGWDVVGSSDAVDVWLDGAGIAVTADLDALLDQEIRAGVPRAGVEVVAPHLPEEIGLLATHVHLAKGCYPGQEAVARMWMLGRPRRALVQLDVEGAARAGDESGQGRDRWHLTRVTTGPPHQALALAPSTAAVGDVVEGVGWAGTVRRLVGSGLEQPGADPKVVRRRDRRSTGGA